MPTSDARTLLPWFALAYGMLILNDVGFLLATDWPAYIAIDYGSRVLVLLLLLVPAAPRAVLLRPETLRIPSGAAITVVIACVVLDRLLEFGLKPVTVLWLDQPALVRFPSLPFPVKIVDLVLGMALVAISEELLCRRATALVLRDRLGTAALVAASTVLFTVMHWTYSPADLVNVFLIGLVLMAVYLWIGALWPLILAHYIIDVLSFW